MDVLDLGIFITLLCLHLKINENSIVELIKVTKNPFWDILRKKLESNFLTFQTCMKDTMKCNGSSKYKNVHMRKDSPRREDRLTVSIVCN